MKGKIVSVCACLCDLDNIHNNLVIRSDKIITGCMNYHKQNIQPCKPISTVVFVAEHGRRRRPTPLLCFHERMVTEEEEFGQITHI